MSTRIRRKETGDGLFIVGLVGRAGSGKSTFAQAFAQRGAKVIDADEIGHQVTDEDPAVRRVLIAEYGEKIYRPDGILDRARVAERVFSDAEARKRLDRLVHPRIVDWIIARLEVLKIEGFRGVVVIDAALLLEWNLDLSCDLVVAVTAPEEVQVSRLMRSRGWFEDEARRRLTAQRANESFSAAADLTVSNGGTSKRALDELIDQTWNNVATIRAERERTAGKGS